MRQVQGLLKVIERAQLVEFHQSALSYRMAQAKELPSLQDFLALALNESPQESTEFDSNTDKFLEAEAQKRLEERRQKHVK